MLPFRNALTSDNPVSDALNLASLQTWYYAALLIGSNLFGIPLILYGHKHYFFLVSISTLVAVIFSMAYHTCQTCGVCFGFSLATLTLADHISAPAFMMMLILFVIDTRSTRHVKAMLQARAQEYALGSVAIQSSPPSSPPPLLQQPAALRRRINDVQASASLNQRLTRFMETSMYSATNRRVAPTTTHNRTKFVPCRPSSRFSSTAVTVMTPTEPQTTTTRPTRPTAYSESELLALDERRTYYSTGYSHMEQNDLSNAWGVYIAYTSIFVAVIAALAHPFSMQAFVIAIVFGLCAVFFKQIVIDEGQTTDLEYRVSMPDLVFGVILIALCLLFYMLDVYWEYGITHTLWHVLSYMGAYFLVIGLSRHVDNWYSPLDYAYRRSLQCCLKQQMVNVGAASMAALRHV